MSTGVAISRYRHLPAGARFALILIVISTLWPIMAAAQNGGVRSKSIRPSRTPTVSQIIERYLLAVGGRAAWLHIKSQYATGTIRPVGSDIEVTYEVFLKAPTKSLTMMKGPNGEFRAGFDGQKSWSQSQRKGAELNVAQYDPSEKQVANKRESDFYKYLHFNKDFPRARVTGIEDVEGAKTYVIEAIPAGETLPERLYFSISTGILLRRDSTGDDGEGNKSTRTQYYDDYREVCGVKVSFAQRANQGLTVMLIKAREIKNNLSMDNAIFDLPSGK